MALARKVLGRAHLITAILIAAAMACGCVAATPPAPTSSDDDDTAIMDEYVPADVLSVDLVEVTDAESIDGCRQWHVELDVEDSTDAWVGSAWYSPQSCLDDEEVLDAGLTILKLTAQQVVAFRDMLAQVRINTWSTGPDTDIVETSGEPVYTVSVLIENSLGLFYDTITVTDTPPANWDVFVSDIKAAAGDASG